MNRLTPTGFLAQALVATLTGRPHYRCNVLILREWSGEWPGRITVSNDPIPEDVQSFIAEHVRSLRGLELLLLIQADRNREWTAPELSHELRATSDWANLELRHLESRGLLIQTDPASSKFRYAPYKTELEAVVTKLADIYKVRPFAITQAIFSVPRDSIRQFADAFRLRREKPDG